MMEMLNLDIEIYNYSMEVDVEVPISSNNNIDQDMTGESEYEFKATSNTIEQQPILLNNFNFKRNSEPKCVRLFDESKLKNIKLKKVVVESDGEWQPANDAHSLFVDETEFDGIRFLRQHNSAYWYAQASSDFRIEVQKDGSVYRCSACNFKNNLSRTKFHVQHTHRGGKECSNCKFVGFLLPTYDAHFKNCKSETIYVIKGNTVQTVQCRPQFTVFFAQLEHENGKNALWCGTGTQTSAELWKEAIQQRLALAKLHNYKRVSGVSLGCTSLIDLVGKGFYIVETFSVNGLLKGSENATMGQKCFIRRILKLPGHHKSKCSESYFTAFSEDIFSVLFAETKIQEKYKMNLRK